MVASHQTRQPLPICSRLSQPVSPLPLQRLLVVLASGVLGQIVAGEQQDGSVKPSLHDREGWWKKWERGYGRYHSSFAEKPVRARFARQQQKMIFRAGSSLVHERTSTHMCFPSSSRCLRSAVIFSFKARSLIGAWPVSPDTRCRLGGDSLGALLVLDVHVLGGLLALGVGVTAITGLSAGRRSSLVGTRSSERTLPSHHQA